MLSPASTPFVKLRITLIFILYCVSMPFEGLTSNTPYFTNLTAREGLISNMTNSVVEDPYGFIWIGTQEGLNRYDGLRMTLFQHSGSPESLSSNNISALLNDGEYIWAGTWDGLNKINIKTHEVTRINTGEARVIRALYQDLRGRIWIGTSKGILVYHEVSGEFLHYHTNNSHLSHNTIRCFYESHDGYMWIGTYDGLNRFNDGDITSYNLKGNYKPLLENNLIVSIKPYLEGESALLWVGTETGLALFNTHSGNFHLFNASNTRLSNEVIKSIYHLNDSILWLGTDFGLNTFNTRNHEVVSYYHDPLIGHTIASNVIWEIFEDRRQGLWLITSNGVSITEKKEPFYRFHEQYFSTQPTRIGNQVKDILVASNGVIWLATIHGVVRKNPETAAEKSFSVSSPSGERILLNNVYALMEDESRRIWIGTAGGINIWDTEIERMFAITSNRRNALLSNYISGFASDCDGNLWVTAWEGGLFKVVWDRNHPDDMQFQLVDSNGDGLLVATPGKVYYGSNHGFWAIHPVSLRKTLVKTVVGAMGDRQLSAVIAGSDNSVWIGTLQQILRYFPENDSIISVEIQTGRPQKIINLCEDNQGYLWATTPDAIIRLHTETFEQTIIPFDNNAPMKGFYPNCAAQTNEGDILFGGDNGYIRITPGKVIVMDDEPQVFISGLFVNNRQVYPSGTDAIIKKDIAFTESLRLSHNQNSVTFEFSTLDYLFPGFVQFQYRLLPGQTEWVFTSGDKNFAVFSNLRPSDYLFEVRGTNRFGNWSETKQLPIKIVPSLWLSWGFVFLYVLLFISGAWYAYRVYRNRRKLRNELKYIRLEKQHAEALYQAKIRFFTNISHEFRTPLTLIIPPLQELLKKDTQPAVRDKMLKLASRNAQRLYKLVNQLLDFSKIEAEKLDMVPSPIELVSFCKNIFDSFDDLAARNETTYTFRSDVEVFYMEADMEKLETIIFNLLSNAFKYTPVSGKISLHLGFAETVNEGQIAEITVTDSGIGISREEQTYIFEQFYQTQESKSLKKGSGIGLTLAQEYAQLHNGRISVSSEPGKGSVFTFAIPVMKMENTGVLQPPEKVSAAKGLILKQENMTLPENAKTILVVDDNEDILDFIDMNLNHRYRIWLARNGNEALDLLEKQPSHLVISDVMMPVMDGIELCARIKQNKVSEHIPVILLTARSLDMHKTEGMNTGADMYITKPFDIEYLQACINSIFRHEEQMEAYIKNRLLLNPENNHDNNKNQDELFLKKIISLIERNLSNPEFSVEMLSNTMGMSATHLYRKLKDITGYSTKEVIMNYRMQKAARMIENNEGNISEIMYSVGFSSLSGFSRSFKARFGVSPTTYASQKPQKQS
jgi:signal transduction histidine kinase/ligand-binding sensor domain-containing protein/DNA-binding response OmpR family regulator